MRFRLKPRRLKKTRNKKRSFPEPCDTDMSFQECELAILRQAVDENENQAKKKIANSDDVKNMISIVEDFSKRADEIVIADDEEYYDSDRDYFESLTVKDLRDIAKTLGIKSSGLKKKELITALVTSSDEK